MCVCVVVCTGFILLKALLLKQLFYNIKIEGSIIKMGNIIQTPN